MASLDFDFVGMSVEGFGEDGEEGRQIHRTSRTGLTFRTGRMGQKITAEDDCATQDRRSQPIADFRFGANLYRTGRTGLNLPKGGGKLPPPFLYRLPAA